MAKFFKGKDEEDEPEGDRKKILPNMNLPIIDRTKLKRSLKCLKWIQKKIQKKGAAFPLFMILLNTIYLTLGGLIFMAVEKQPKVVVNTSQELVEIFDVLKVSFRILKLNNWRARQLSVAYPNDSTPSLARAVDKMKTQFKAYGNSQSYIIYYLCAF